MITISYAITVCNEATELDRLLSIITDELKEADEIVILSDEGNTTLEVYSIIDTYKDNYKSIRHIEHKLNNDFSTHKNFLLRNCNCDYIFNIDADEFPHEVLLSNIHTILEENNDVDLIYVPRINTVSGITQTHIDNWGWTINDHGWVNFPDYQGRLIKNIDTIEWNGTVHERIVGAFTISFLPAEDIYCLVHNKDIDKQEKQNNFYETLIN